jgi:hypothetical protein
MALSGACSQNSCDTVPSSFVIFVPEFIMEQVFFSEAQLPEFSNHVES